MLNRRKEYDKNKYKLVINIFHSFSSFFIESCGLMSEKSKPRYAHRTILAAASPYFNAMFTSDFVEAVDAKRQQVSVVQGYTNQPVYMFQGIKMKKFICLSHQ